MTQTDFRNALLDPAAPVPSGLIDPQGRPAGKRFDVYRNNVAGSLITALESGFPVLRQIVGPAFFTAMAGVFLRAHPPKSRLIMLYGTDMPAFLTHFAPVGHLPYLPDVARLELAMRQAYHAADAAPMNTQDLGQIGPQHGLTLAPAMRVLTSDWAIFSIWDMNTTGPLRPILPRGEAVLILRPAFDPQAHAISAAASRFVMGLLQGETVLMAAEAAGAELDLVATLHLLVSGGGIVGTRE